MNTTRRSLAGVILAPLPAVAVGALVMAGAQLPPGLWLQNVAAAGLGLLGVWALILFDCQGRILAKAPGWAALAAVLLLVGTLLSPGVDGVHRWIPVGPLRLHAAALVLPALLAASGRMGVGASAAAALPALVVLALQPDASQVMSFGAAWVALVAFREAKGGGLAVVAVGLAALVSARRQGFLEPVPHVEGIIGLAAGQGTVLVVTAVLVLAAVPLALGTHRERAVGVALGTYVTGTLVAPWMGPYPVPMLGYGMSPILGYYLGVGVLLLAPPPVLSADGQAGPAPVDSFP